MKIDLHVHIRRAHNLSEIRSVLKKRNIDAIAITNFFDISLAQWVQKRLPEFLVIVGQEVESSAGHILAIDIRENIPNFLTPHETIAQIHAQGGLAILAHPFLIYHSLVPLGKYAHLPFDAIEVFNFRASPLLFPNILAQLILSRRSVPLVANSDSKDVASIGICHNKVPGKTKSEVLENIKKGHIERHTEMVWPNPAWIFQFGYQHFTHHRAFTCPVCGTNFIRTILPQKQKCLVCGEIQKNNIICPEKHFICKPCRTQRDFKTEYLEKYRKELGIDLE
ncbi:MAG: hypothetical protein DWQ05_11950 [Calditrichaeota bacterium]|nr:MAG: hypothetical protein DWQ05_11950 [Calditrichota bacterium]